MRQMLASFAAVALAFAVIFAIPASSYSQDASASHKSSHSVKASSGKKKAVKSSSGKKKAKSGAKKAKGKSRAKAAH